MIPPLSYRKFGGGCCYLIPSNRFTTSSASQKSAARVIHVSFQHQLLTVFAVIALLLSLIGIYGVIAYSVGQRTREFGVHLALGSRPSQLLGFVLGQGAWLSLAGVAIGFGLLGRL